MAADGDLNETDTLVVNVGDPYVEQTTHLSWAKLPDLFYLRNCVTGLSQQGLHDNVLLLPAFGDIENPPTNLLYSITASLIVGS